MTQYELKQTILNSILTDANRADLFYLDFNNGWNEVITELADDYFPNKQFRFSLPPGQTIDNLKNSISLISGTEIKFQVTGEYYPFNQLSVDLKFSILPENVTLIISAASNGQKISTYLPLFLNSLADRLTLKTITFELDSNRIATDEVSFLNIYAKLDLDNSISGFNNLLSLPPVLDLQGPAWLKEGGSKFYGIGLFADPLIIRKTLTVPGFAITLKDFAIIDESVYSFVKGTYFSYPFLLLNATLKISEVDVPVQVEIGNPETDIHFSADLNNIAKFGLSAIEDFLGVDQNSKFFTQLPGDFTKISEDLKKVEDKIKLDEFGLYYSPKDGAVSSVYGGIKFDSSFEISDTLSASINGFNFNLISPGTDNILELGVGGEIKVGNGNGCIELQATKNASGYELAGWLKENTEIKLSEIIELFVEKNNNPKIPDLSVHKLDFDFKKDDSGISWLFDIELKGRLPVPFNNPAFYISQIDFSIVNPGSAAPVQFLLGGIFSIASVDIAITAKHNKGWFFIGSTGPNQEIPFGEYIEILWNYLLPGPGHKLPDAISHLIAENISLEIDTTSGFSFKAGIEISESRSYSDSNEISDRDNNSPELLSSGDPAIKLTDIVLSIERSDSIKFTAKANFSIKQFEFTVDAEYNDGWSFDADYEKGNSPGISIESIADAFNFEVPALPEFLSKFTIDEITLSYISPAPAKDGSTPVPGAKAEKHFKLTGSDIVEGATIKFDLKLDITYPEGQENISFSGHMTINDVFVFDIVQQKSGTGKIFLAAYHQENDAGKIDIHNLLQGLGVDAPSINLSLKDAFFVNDKSPSEYNLLVADIGAGMNLSNLPLVGKVLPADATVTVALRVLYASAKYGASVDAVNTILPDGISKISKPQDDNASGLDLIAEIKIGDQKFYLELPIKLNDPLDKDNPVVNKNNSLPNQPAVAAGNQTNAAVPVNDGITWFKIGKTFGPVIFNRIGLTYKDSKLSVYPDAALSMGGLNFTLNGLSVSSPITEFKPSFDLKGLGLDFKKGPLEIGASFLRRQITINGETVDEFDGMAIISTSKLSLSALGSYCYFNGHPSLFIYAYLNQALGGPAFFFVEGLAAAFGYNRSLIMPAIDQVSTFPLVRQVMAGNDPSAATADRALLLTQQLDALNKYVPPSAGEMFFAIGIKFSSFKLIDSFVLLAISFGNHFEIDVLGQSNIVVPSESPPGLSPLAEIKIQLMAKFLPDEGFLGVMAQLTSDSYILSRECHLSGGAAFYSWFKGEHEGDFVVTMGGYHPAFNVPAHYPRVPRLALNWQVCRELSIKGDMYFALCTHAFMAGGHLEALFTDGPLQAWFKAGADFLIMWQPYHYDARMYLDIGASYTYHFFGTHHITIDVGADVHIWGPEFAGKATVHIWIIDVTVAFGPQGNSSPTPIGWEEFKKKCLPAKEKTISAAIIGGKHSEDDNKTAIVNPKELNIAVDSAVPVTKFSIPKSDQGLPNGSNPFGIAPMNIPGNISSTQTISIKKLEAGTYVELEKEEKANFIFTSVSKKVPSAIWGTKFSPGLNATERTIELVTGLNITTKEPAEFPIGGNPFKSLDDLLDFRPPLALTDSIPRLDYTEESNEKNIKKFRAENKYFDSLCSDLDFGGISILTKK